MADRIEYSASIPGKSEDRRNAWFKHIRELQRKNIQRRIEALEAGKKHDPYREMKLAKLKASLERIEKM